MNIARQLDLVDRAGFEPAAFRFFFAWMRTGRSLAPEHIRAYQAELPALECHKTYPNLNGLSDPLNLAEDSGSAGE